MIFGVGSLEDNGSRDVWAGTNGEDSNLSKEISSANTKFAGPLILDFPSLQNHGKFLFLNHPAYGLSVYHRHSDHNI